MMCALDNIKTGLAILSACGFLVSARAEAAARTAEISGARMLMGEVLPKLAERIGAWEVDLGPSPQPGRTRTLTRRHIRAQLRRAQLDMKRLRLPERLLVRRRAQTMTREQLSSLLMQVMQEKLPKNAVVLSVNVQQGVVVSEGAFSVKLESPQRWRHGQQSVAVRLLVDGKKQRRIVVRADVQLPERSRAQVVMKRGARVSIIVRTGDVVVRTRGVVQSAGKVGEVVPVLPVYSRKLVHARVIAEAAVQVDL